MLRVLPLAGAAMIAFGAMTGADARMVTYEVNGQRYSYSTNNREQTVAARRHLEAAKAAADAKAKAEAEKASNPLAAVFGSAAQREAAQAQAAIDQARPANGTVAAPAARTARTEAEKDARPQRKERLAKGAPVSAEPAEERPSKIAAVSLAPAKVKSVSFDAVTGIKTTFMTDGSIHEEPFDGTALSSAAEPSVAASLNAFVDQLRPVGHVETTGSTWTAAQPENPARLKPSRP